LPFCETNPRAIKRTTGKHIERLKTFFKFAHDFEWVKKNSARPLKPPKIEESEARPFTEDEVDKILKAVGKYKGNGAKFNALMLLMLSTGLRIGDAVVITRDKFVNDKTGWKLELRTAKTSTAVYCPIPDKVAEAVLGIPGEHPFWTGKSNTEDCAATWRKSFAKLFKLAVIEGTPHQFRHTLAKRMLVSGVPIALVSQVLGHRKTEVTQRHYNKWVPERQTKLEEAVRNTWIFR
jgi:integrase